MNGLRHFVLLGAFGVLAACSGVATPEGGLEAQGLQTQWLNNWTSVGGDCQAMFTRNPAVIKTVDNVYIKVVGPIGTVPDPGRWYVHSPTLSMTSSAGFGVHGTNYVSGNEYYESNTSLHDGPFPLSQAPGRWSSRTSTTCPARTTTTSPRWFLPWCKNHSLEATRRKQNPIRDGPCAYPGSEENVHERF